MSNVEKKELAGGSGTEELTLWREISEKQYREMDASVSRHVFITEEINAWRTPHYFVKFKERLAPMGKHGEDSEDEGLKHKYVGFGDEPFNCKICSQEEDHPYHRVSGDETPTTQASRLVEIRRLAWDLTAPPVFENLHLGVQNKIARILKLAELSSPSTQPQATQGKETEVRSRWEAPAALSAPTAPTAPAATA
jgi:hypothetical protein